MAKSAPPTPPVEPERHNPADYGRRRVPHGGEPAPAPEPAVPSAPQE